MTTLTITTTDIEAAGGLDSDQLVVPEGAFTADMLRGAQPTLDRLATLVRTQPDDMLALVKNFQAGRLDVVEISARNLGLLPEQSKTSADGQLAAPIIWVIRIIVAIIIILLFPTKTGKPVKPPTRD